MLIVLFFKNYFKTNKLWIYSYMNIKFIMIRKHFLMLLITYLINLILMF